jgi:undecaprenyl pyrophosphate synthase
MRVQYQGPLSLHESILILMMPIKTMRYDSIVFGGECPRHLALIMDGNRRYAQVRRKLPHEGHQMGFGTLEQVLGWCEQLLLLLLFLFRLLAGGVSLSGSQV